MIGFRKRIDKVLDVKEQERIRDEQEDVKLEKGDIPAMLIAALIVIGPVVLGAIALLLLVAWLFGAFR